jgi:copper chaperone NosL
MSRKWLCCILMAFCLLTVSALLLISPVGAADRGTPKPTAKDKCPVCGMLVAKYTDWMSVVVFKDGSRAFFDGPKDMFKYLLEMKRYNPSKKTEDIDFIAVTDYYLVSPIDARKAWYVLGSDVFGPMGKELVPLGKESDAKEFMKDHKGQRILRFSEVTAEVMKTLD